MEPVLEMGGFGVFRFLLRQNSRQQFGNLRHNLADFPQRLRHARRETVKTVELLSRTLITPLKRGVNERGTCGGAPARTADFQSAVSRISNPQGWGQFRSVRNTHALPTGSRRCPPAWRRAGSRLETCGTTSRISHNPCAVGENCFLPARGRRLHTGARFAKRRCGLKAQAGFNDPDE